MNTFKLAARNVYKSHRDYGVYFLTIIIGIAMFYVFNSLDGTAMMMELSENQVSSLLGVNKVMSGLSVFISAILAFLILYANAFLIKRRKKEMGIYMTLGMRKGKISQILIYETTLVGLVSLLVGLVPGLVLSQGLALFTAKLFNVSMTGFTFTFSVPAMLKSILYFGIAFVLVMLFNTVIIGKQRLLDLIYADKMVSAFRTPHLISSIILFFISLTLLAVAYAIIIKSSTLGGGKELIVSIVLGTLGTFLFFYSFSGSYLKLVSKMKRIYFKDLNIFTLGQQNSTMNTTHISMSFACLMLFIAISAISVGSSVAESIRNNYSVIESGTVAGVTYITLYIGIVFIVACASVLAITQLSEASDTRVHYELLGKLGASNRLLAKSIFKQISLYFALPLILAVVHSTVAIIVMSKVILAIGDVNILATSFISALLIIVLYGCYFLMTYFSAKRMASLK